MNPKLSLKILKEIEQEVRQLVAQERAKVSRQHGMKYEQQVRFLLSEIAHENIPQPGNLLAFYNKWSKLQVESMGSQYEELIPNLDRNETTDNKQDETNAKKYIGEVVNQEVDNKIGPDDREKLIRRQRWAVAMSEEMQEVLKDFKNY